MSEGLEVGKQVDSSGAGSDQWAAAQGWGGVWTGHPPFPVALFPLALSLSCLFRVIFSAAWLAFSLPPSPHHSGRSRRSVTL